MHTGFTFLWPTFQLSLKHLTHRQMVTNWSTRKSRLPKDTSRFIPCSGRFCNFIPFNMKSLACINRILFIHSPVHHWKLCCFHFLAAPSNATVNRIVQRALWDTAFAFLWEYAPEWNYYWYALPLRFLSEHHAVFPCQLYCFPFSRTAHACSDCLYPFHANTLYS